MRALNYIQRFNFEIRHKFDKQHIMSNALSRLINFNINISIDKQSNENELNVFFTMSLMKIKSNFKKRILNDYKIDLN